MEAGHVESEIAAMAAHVTFFQFIIFVVILGLLTCLDRCRASECFATGRQRAIDWHGGSPTKLLKMVPLFFFPNIKELSPSLPPSLPPSLSLYLSYRPTKGEQFK